MYTAEFAFAVPVKYAPGTNENICVVYGSNGIAAPVVVTVAEFAVALAAVFPTPRYTITEPEFCTRYWFAAVVEDAACTGVGAELAAVKTTVLPIGEKAMMPMIFPYVLIQYSIATLTGRVSVAPVVLALTVVEVLADAEMSAYAVPVFAPL